ncbi:MAG: cysteinyl-tRNA synthetase [Myxococcota bacterium]|jgi:cysteinyl-tRNA synthetase
MAQPFSVYSTSARAVQPFVPVTPGHVGIYVCGMTVYDDAHIGHARAFVLFDVITRYLRHRGWRVTLVRNFTDIDDKIIRRAAQTGAEPLALADHYIDSFQEDATALGLLPPDHEPRVTGHIPDIIALIARLVERGFAYASGGSVWFSVPSDADYGRISGQGPGEPSADADTSAKRHPADFALWKGERPGEPAWDSPWGRGRPGWHIECSAMSMRYLGDTLDIHGGGTDLVFPHHENEAAQSTAATGKPYANCWVHNGLLNIRGQKMGHSAGNFITVKSLLAAYPAEALRLYYLQNHYRSALLWSDTALSEALTMLARLYEARESAEGLGGTGDADAIASQIGKPALVVLRLGRGFPTRLTEAMDADFNTASALGHAFTLARAINRLVGVKGAARKAGPVVAPALAALSMLTEATGLLAQTPAAFWAETSGKRLAVLGLSAADIEVRVQARQQARADRDWAKADAIRAALSADGIAVFDRPGGISDWRVAL